MVIDVNCRVFSTHSHLAKAHVSLVILMSCARYTQSRSFAELVSNLQEDQLDPRMHGLGHVEKRW